MNAATAINVERCEDRISKVRAVIAANAAQLRSIRAHFFAVRECDSRIGLPEACAEIHSAYKALLRVEWLATQEIVRLRRLCQHDGFLPDSEASR